MAQFYFHLRDGADKLLDPDGIECDRDAVAGKALGTVRDLIAHDAVGGAIDLTYRIEVEDAAGQIVHLLRFEDAVTINRGKLPVPV